MGGTAQVLQVLAVFGPLSAAIVALVMLGPKRTETVGNSLGQALEDLAEDMVRVRGELTLTLAERDAARRELADLRVELHNTVVELATALDRIRALEEGAT